MAAREHLEYDVVVVGAGPAGLATAIHLKQLAERRGRECSVCVLEKGSEVGAHILSGAVIDPAALGELFPNWRFIGAPLHQAVTDDRFMFLTERQAWKFPRWALPECFVNEGNYVASLGKLCRWLGNQAEGLGVEIYPGFAAVEVLFTDDGRVRGVATGDVGVGRSGERTSRFQPGIEIAAKYTVFAEGCRGHLGKMLQSTFDLRKDCAPQVYGVGIKELWEVRADCHVPGLVVHTAGWPLQSDTYGGSFMYHFEENQVAVGFVVGLGYRNPYLSPFEEMQRYKTHPAIRGFFEGGRRISYGARAISAGGLQSLPRLVFPGGALVGDDAGFLNASRIKGIHAAIKSGMLAASAACDALVEGRSHDELSGYPEAFSGSWLHEELRRARNFKPWMSKGLYVGTLMAGLDQKLLRGKAPWTLTHAHEDHETLVPKAEARRIDYPKPDGMLTFDRLSSVFASNTSHAEDQPVHIKVADSLLPLALNLPVYGGPEARYCPAGVYEFPEDAAGARLQINAANCLHCKTCDIKDPSQNIQWSPPEGAGGPNYPNM